MRKIVCMVALLLYAAGALAQSEDVLRAARYLSGAASDEEVDEEADIEILDEEDEDIEEDEEV